MNKLITITVIIPTLNNYKGLKYLLNYFQNKPYPLIIIDNLPTKEKQLLIKPPRFDKIKKVYPERSRRDKTSEVNSGITYLPQSKNLGFAASINLGAKYVKTDWMLILNDDIEFSLTTKHQPLNTFMTLLNFAKKNNLVATSPVLKKPNGEVENCGYQVLPYGRVQLIKQLSNATMKQYNIDGLTAACLLIKTDIFRKLNGFDEHFFAYLEDVDFFLRLKTMFQKQFANETMKQFFGVCLNSEVIHHQLTTSKTMANFKTKQDLINWIRLIYKHPDIFPIRNPVNCIFLLIERFRNLSGYIKSTIFSQGKLSRPK